MDVIIGWSSYETKFLDDPVTMELRSLRTEAFFKLLPLMQHKNAKQPKESVEKYLKRLTPEEKIEIQGASIKTQKLSVEIFPDHVKNITGITLNGKAPTFEDLAQEAIFLNLAVDICGELISRTKLTRDEEKNSEGLSASSTQDD